MNNQYGKYNKEVTLLSLDTSSTKTGWAIFKDAKYIKSGVIDWSYIKDGNNRAIWILNDIIYLIESNEPSIVVIEKDVVGSGKRLNMSTINILTKIIGGVWGYIWSINREYPIDEFPIFYAEYAPSEWRKFVDIKGRKREEYKQASIKRIKDVYNIDVDDNEADAINIGDAYIKQWG